MTSAARPFHFGTSARYKLGLKLPQDRAAAADLLRGARRVNQLCLWRNCRLWRVHLEVAASFALQAAEVAKEEGDERGGRIFDHIAYIMEEVADLRDLMPAE